MVDVWDLWRYSDLRGYEMRSDRYKADPSLLRCHLSHKRQAASSLLPINRSSALSKASMNACEFSLTSIEVMIGTVAKSATMVSGGVGGFPSEISLPLPTCDRVFMDIKSMEMWVAAGLQKP